jgi:hypothetical protein
LPSPPRGWAFFAWPKPLMTTPMPWRQAPPAQPTPPGAGAQPGRPVMIATVPPVAGQSAMVTTTQPVTGPVPTPARVITEHISFIGDSVMLGAAAPILALGNTDIDARVSRQVVTAYEILRSRHAAGTLGPIVVLHIGNNGPMTVQQFDDIMALLAGAHEVIFLSIEVPRAWAGPNNQILVEGVARYPNTTLIDWLGLTRGHPEYFWADGMHLRPEGARFYTDLIVSHIKPP